MAESGPEPSRRADPQRLGIGAFGALTVLLVLGHLAWPDGLIGELSYLGVIVGAGVVAVLGAVRQPPGDRTAWSWIAFGVCLSASADLAYSVYVHVQGVDPDVSIADVPWLASYVALSVGLLMLLRSARRGDRSDVDGMIDMAVVAVVALLVVWQVAVNATVSDTSIEPGVRAVWASYPILDAALLALVLRTAFVRSGAWLLVVGVGAWLFSDFFYMLFPDSASWGVWLDAGWMVGAAAIAAAMWQHGSTRVSTPRSETVGAGRVALAIAPLLVPGVIEVVSNSRGSDPNPVPLLIASFLLAGLAFARALRLLRAVAQAQAELESAERHFGALVQRSTDAALVLDLDGTVRYVSPAARVQFGYSVDALVGTVGWDLVHPDDLERTIAAFAVVATPGAHASVELRIKDAAGEWRWVEEVVTNLIDDPAVRGLVANIRDISTRKAAEQELVRLAHYDRLTGLPNRWQLAQQLAETLTADADPVALFVIDLDQFKAVNDSRGHAVGDELLKVVAECLGASLPTGDTLGRIGGDEFAVICREVHDVADALRRAAAIHGALGGLVDVRDVGSFFITCSIGITISESGDSPELLLQQADTAMYEAKGRGPAQSIVFDDQLQSRAEEQLTVLAELRTALRAHELVVHYQPVIDLATGTVEGVEALVRWRHPTRGLLMPGEFIPIAEHSELIDHIGDYVLDQACIDAAWWARAGTPISVAVNISATQLGREHITDTIRSALYSSGLDATSLVVEITETALLVGAERAMENVVAIRSIGARVALDDFGTGYSSLAYLKQVPADIIKIDRSFITGITTDPTDRDIVAAIINLSRALGRTVVAEGIETEEQHRAIRRLGCPFAQGYLWSRAVAAEEILALANSTFTPSAGRDLLQAVPPR